MRCDSAERADIPLLKEDVQMKKFPFLAVAGFAMIIAAGEITAQEPVPTPTPTPVPTPTPEPIPDPMPPIPEPIPEPIPNPLPTDTTPPAAAIPPAEEVADTNSVIGRLQADGRFTMLIAALKQTGIDKELDSTGAVTLFAPTDEAFEQLSEEDVTSLMSDSTKLSELLRHHVVARAITSSDVMDSTEVETLAGDSLTVQSDNGMVTVEDASVIQADLTAGSSVVHAVDHVIVKKDKAMEPMPAKVPPTVPPTTPPPSVPPTVPPVR